MKAAKIKNYQITIIANVNSSLSKQDLELRLVASLFDFETEQKTSDGENDQLEVEDYELTEAMPI
jgi:hypothetical protein